MSKRVGKPESKPERQATEAEATHQEKDFSNRKNDDDCESVQMAAASNRAFNDDDSTYTELSEIRVLEDHYQSLTRHELYV